MQLIKTIEHDLLDDKVSLSSILRKAYVLARQIEDKVLIEWVQNELNGYAWSQWEGKPIDAFPKYRRPGAQLKGTGPYNITKPVLLENPTIHEKICFPPIVYSVPEIESLILENKDSICMTVSPETTAILCKAIRMQMFLFLSYSKSSFVGIVETVRNKLLQIIMDVKDKLPDADEAKPNLVAKQALSKSIIQIINNPQGCQFTIGQSVSYTFEEFKGILELTLTNEGISAEKANKLLEVLDKTKVESPPKQTKKMPQRILDFIKENKSWITETIVDVIKKFWLG